MHFDAERAELAAMAVQWGRLPGGRVRHAGGVHVFAAQGPPWMTQVRLRLDDGDGLDGLDAALRVAPGALVSAVDGTVDDARLRAGAPPGVRQGGGGFGVVRNLVRAGFRDVHGLTSWQRG